MSTSTALTQEQILAALSSIVGRGHTSIREEAVISAPGDVRQIAEVLRFAQANRLVVMPVGAGTKLGWGNQVAAGIELSTRRLTQLREHAWQDMTCTVESGCPWATMQTQLAQHRQTVALDPLWPERATVGGIVATNDSGALRLKFGGLRDLIIGMTIVLPDGTIAKSGGKVVKNVAGYDLHKLMTGSFGTLGVIAEVNFRLHPAEQHAQTWTAVACGGGTGDAVAFADPLFALMDSQTTPSAVQLRASKKECALDIRIAAPPECLDDYNGRLRTLFDRFAINASGSSVWNARQQIFDSGADFVFKVSMVPDDLCAIVSELQNWAAAGDHDIAVVGQATGLMTVGLSAGRDAANSLLDRLRARAEKYGGSVIVLRIPDAARGAMDVWGMQLNALPLMREIKRRFDPGCNLNPGRFVGNI